MRPRRVSVVTPIVFVGAGVTTAEYAIIRAAANLRGVTISDYIRHRINDHLATLGGQQPLVEVVKPEVFL